jgi:hypothetical protein
MRIKTSLTTSLTRTGALKVNTRTKVPMLPVMRTSTTLPISPPKGKRRKKK